ncbi:MAG: MdtA/MuxA family multidrug efflux RND transporter periplasmic adaptor subunit [Thermodesulfobacteriota bacterium]
MDQKNKGISELPKRRHGFLLRYWWIILVVIVLAGAVTFTYWGKSKNKQPGIAKKEISPLARAIPVMAVTAKEGDMKVFLNGLGSVTPINTVTIKSRVDGQLMEVLFREGQIVARGQLLARIDPRPFEVQLTQAEGQMARDQAILKNARDDLERYRTLWKQDLIQKQMLDTQEALVRQYEGTIKTDQGLIDNARLQLIYCRITAPVSGRTGLRLVDPGNIVHAADPNGLLVITQLQPITVVFSLPEDSLARVLPQLKAGQRPQVDVYDREQSKKLATGFLLTVDNQIDPNTGTFKLKAMFENKDQQLFPNQFVNASLLVNVKHNTIIIPAAAIQRGSQGTYVYSVKTDRTVELRPVTAGEIQNGEVSIEKGLSAGALVVVDGAERLREGAKVELKGPGNGRGGRSG